MPDFSTRTANWDDDKAALMQIRRVVFVEGQNVPASLESDDYDSDSWYVLAELTNGTPIGCARLQPNGKVTRIAVLDEFRRQGIARQMLRDIITLAESNNMNTLYLHAQISAIGLYEQFDFVQSGDQFEEAGIQHVKMTRSSA